MGLSQRDVDYLVTIATEVVKLIDATTLTAVQTKSGLNRDAIADIVNRHNIDKEQIPGRRPRAL